MSYLTGYRPGARGRLIISRVVESNGMGDRINNHLTNLVSSQLSSSSHLLLVTWHLEEREEHPPRPHHAVASFSLPPLSTSPVFDVPVAVTSVSPLPLMPLPHRLPLPSLLFRPSDLTAAPTPLALPSTPVHLSAAYTSPPPPLLLPSCCHRSALAPAPAPAPAAIVTFSSV